MAVCTGTRGDGRVGLDVTAKVAAMATSQVPQYVEAFSSQQVLRSLFPLFRADGIVDDRRDRVENNGSSVHISDEGSCCDEVFVVEVRGEVYLDRETCFNTGQETGPERGSTEGARTAVKGGELLGTPRNRAAGILRQKPALSQDQQKYDDARLLKFFAYTLHLPSPLAFSFSSASAVATGKEMESIQRTADVLQSQTQSLKVLSAAGFQVASSCRTFGVSVDGEEDKGHDRIMEHIVVMEAGRSDLRYDTDGVVLKVIDTYYNHSLTHANMQCAAMPCTI